MRGAEYLLSSRMSSGTPRTAEEAVFELDSALSLAPTAVRALYAMQLELDTVLPIRIAAQCRRWAEERHQLRSTLASANSATPGEGGTAGAGSSPASAHGTAPSSAGHGSAPSSVTMYVAVLNASNLKGSVASGGLLGPSVKKIEAHVSMKVAEWEGVGTGGYHEMSTEVSARVTADSNMST
jgi:hypothetical protein